MWILTNKLFKKKKKPLRKKFILRILSNEGHYEWTYEELGIRLLLNLLSGNHVSRVVHTTSSTPQCPRRQAFRRTEEFRREVTTGAPKV